MNGGNLLGIVIGVGTLVVAILGLLVVGVDERSTLARIRAWSQQGRTERDALKRRISELEERLDLISTVLQKESDARVAERDEITQRAADMKLRLDNYGQRIERTETNIVTDGLELHAIGSKQKQLETQLASYAKTLNEMREQLTELRQHDNDLLGGSAVQYGALDRRLRKLEGRPPAGYQGTVQASGLFDPDDSTG